MQLPSRRALDIVPGATFDANFRTGLVTLRNGGVFDRKPVEDLFTTARASAGQMYGAGGLLTLAPAQTLRLVNDPVTGAPAGLLTEGPGSNYLIPSNDLTARNLNAITIGGLAAGPDGARSLAIVAATADGAFASTGDIVIPGADQYWTVSQYCRGTSVVWLELYIHKTDNTAVALGRVYVDLNNGRITSFVATTGTVRPVVEPGPDGSWRIGLSGRNTAGAGTRLAMTSGFLTANGSAYRGLEMIEPRDGFSSYIPALSGPAPITRAADYVTMPLSSMPGYNPDEGTFYLEMMDDSPLGMGYVPFSVNDGTSANQMTLQFSPQGPSYVWSSSTGVFLPVGGVARGAPLRFALTYFQGSVWRIAKTGGGGDYTIDNIGVPSSPNTVIPSNLSRIDLGHAFGTNGMQGRIGRFAYRPRALPAVDLSTLVTV